MVVVRACVPCGDDLKKKLANRPLSCLKAQGAHIRVRDRRPLTPKTPGLFSLSRLSRSLLLTQTLSHVTNRCSHIVCQCSSLFSLPPPSVFIRDGWCPHTLHTSPLVTTMQTVAAGSSHVCASEPARHTNTLKHTHFARGLSASRAHCSLSHSNP